MKAIMHWLFFLLTMCQPCAIMATASASVPATAPLPSLQNFPSTEPEFETLHDADSITNQPITALAQDARGLIWIGTQYGLVRYDGYRFRKFVHKAGDPFSLAGNYVYSLYIAKDGRIWVGTLSDGISVFDPASERFEHFRHDEKVKDSLPGGIIWSMAGDGQDGMWVATGQGLTHLAAGSKRFTHFRHSLDPHSLLDDQVRSLLLDKAGHLWVGSRSGLQRLTHDSKRFETVMTGKEVLTLFQAQDGKLWLGTRAHGAAWLGGTPLGGNPQQVHWLPLAQLSHPWVAGIAQAQPDQIWLATIGGGIIVVSANDGQIQQTLRHDQALTGSLAFDTIKPLLLDRAGWLWVGTWGAGLQRTNANNTMLRVLRHSPKRAHGLSHADVWSMLELANGQLLIGSRGNGIDIFDRQRGLAGGWRPGQSQRQDQRQGLAGTLPDADIISLAQTGDGAIWAGTQQAGVVRLRSGSDTWEAIPGLPDKSITKLFAGRDGSVWAGTNFGVARWQPAASRIAASSRFEALTDESGKLIQARIVALADDSQGRTWVGTDNGLWLHKPGQKGLIAIPAAPTHPDGLVSDRIVGLLLDRRDRLWVSTDKGLERLKSLDGKQARFEHVSALLGQAGKALGENLLEDDRGRIWTEEAIIEPDILPAGRLSMTHGFGKDIGTTWAGSYAKTRDGLLLFGGSKGVVLIDPARFKVYDHAPPLVVTELKINGKTVPPQGLINPLAVPLAQARSDGNVSLTLKSAQRNFAIEFAALDYSDPKKNHYQYRLEGYDKDWINTNSDHRSAAYGNLWPGRYILQVRGSNRQGNWSTHELRIPIRVLPAWWQTWWFALVLLLLMGSLVAALVQVRTRYLRQHQRELEQLVDERTGQLQETQQQLVLQEKMAGLGTLTAGIAHEINNPTNFIHVSAQIQQADIAEFKQFVANLIEEDEEQAILQAFDQRFAKLSGNVDTILNGTERIIGIVKDLRSFSRLDESTRKTVRLSECLHANLNLVRTTWQEKVEFITELTDDPELECWPALLNRVFINLLLNGCQAIEAKQARAALPANEPANEQTNEAANEPAHQRGKLWLRLHLNPGKDALQIEFEDNGTGIEHAIQRRIMEPFFTTKEVGSGTGTGLSTAFGIVQKHHGKLEFTSTPGAGSCFTVTLPLTGV